MNSDECKGFAASAVEDAGPSPDDRYPSPPTEIVGGSMLPLFPGWSTRYAEPAGADGSPVFSEIIGERLLRAPHEPGSWFACDREGGDLPPAVIPSERSRDISCDTSALLETASALPQAYFDHHAPKGAATRDISGEKLVVLYLRTSTDKQDTSLESQEREGRAACAKEGLTVVAVEYDEGRTGTRMIGRPGLQKALDRIVAGEANILGAFTASRVSRDPSDLLFIWQQLEDVDARFYTCDRAYIGEFEILLEAVYGRRELKRMKLQLRVGFETKVAMGHSAPCSFAYERDRRKPGVRTIHPGRAGWVLWAFLQRLAGVERATIARAFSEAGIPEPRECTKIDNGKITLAECRCRWTAGMIDKMLRNPIYMGWYVTRKTKTIFNQRTGDVVRTERMPPEKWLRKFNPELVIVPAAIWRKIFVMREAMQSLRRTPEAARRRPITYALNCKTSCGCSTANGTCGGPTKSYNTTSWGTHTLACRTSLELPDRCEGFGRVETALLERTVYEALGREIMSVRTAALFRTEYETSREASLAKLEAQRRLVLAKLDAAKRACDECLDDCRRIGFGLEETARQGKRAESRVAQAQAELLALPQPGDEIAGLARLGTLAEGLASMAHNAPFRAEGAKGRALIDALRALVDRIVIRPPDRHGVVALEIHIDIERLVGAPAPEVTFFPTASVIHATFDQRAADEEGRAITRANHATRLAGRAASEDFDLSPEAWAAIEPIVGDFECKIEGGVRRLCDGLMFFLRMPILSKDIPARYGDAKLFLNETKRFVRSGRWDRVAEVLRREAPFETIGWCPAKISSSAFARNVEGRDRPFAKLDADEVRAFKHLAKSDAQKARFEMVAMCRSQSSKEVAEHFGQTPARIRAVVSGFDCFGPSNIVRGPGQAQPRLTREQVQGLRPFLEANQNPLEPGDPLRIDAVCHHVRLTLGIEISPARMATYLRDEGMGLRQLNQARAEAAAQAEAEKHGGSALKDLRIPALPKVRKKRAVHWKRKVLPEDDAGQTAA